MKKLHSISNLYRHQQGQSLVETAIIAPILIFMLLGVFEVGWALRGYLVLANVSREATRFAVRPNYLNYSEKPPTGLTTAQVKEWVGQNVGYNNTIDHMFASLSKQVDTTDTLSPAMVISHLVIDTGYPCDDIQNNKDCDGDGKKTSSPTQESPTEDCDGFVKNGYAGFTLDDKIIHPGVSGYENFYAFTYDPDPTDAISYTTTYSYPQLAKQLAAENNQFNCDLLKRTPSATPSPNYVLITEMFYKQPQLFGFPLISNPFTDPVPMFAHTTMRMINSRSGNDLDKVGPLCIAIPFTIRNDKLTGATVDVTVFDIMGGAHPELANGNERGFLAWDPQWQNVDDLNDEFSFPEASFNSYTNVKDSTDHKLTVGDYVKSLPGNNDASTIRAQLDALISSGQDVILPVWDQFDSATSSYRISTFIKVRLVSSPAYHLTSGNPEVWAVYRGPATECLQ